MTTASKRRGGYRSLFWPFILIGIGIIWLLANMGVLTVQNFAVLDRVWPLLLIIIGLDLLFGRQSPQLGALIGIGAVVLIVVLMLVGPSLGLAPNWDLQTDNFNAPVGDATSARVRIAASVGSVRIHALTDSPNLIDADLTYLGEIRFDVTGESQKTVELGQVEGVSYSTGGFTGLFGFLSNSDLLRWDVRLNPDVPMDLNIEGSVGDTTLDLRDLNLTSLRIAGGVGEIQATIPATDDPYNVEVTGSVGNFALTILENTAVTARVDGGVGGVTLDVPENGAVRIEMSGGLGGVTLPDSYRRVGGGSDPNQGTWETESYRGAERRIIITYSGGVGGMTVR